VGAVNAHRTNTRHLASSCGEPDWPAVGDWRQQLHRDFEHTLAETKLPERPNYEATNGFILRARRRAVGSGFAF
jgi:uncharacterized protein